MIEFLKSHTSVRRYKDEPITDETFYQMIQVAQHASSSNFVQAYSVIQVKDEKKKVALGKLSNNQLQFETAALSLLFCADLKRVERAVQMHHKEIEGGTVENFTVAIIQPYLLKTLLLLRSLKDTVFVILEAYVIIRKKLVNYFLYRIM